MNIDFHHSFMPIPPPQSTQYSVQEQPLSLFQVADTSDSEIDTVLCLLDNACYFAKAYALQLPYCFSYIHPFLQNHLVSSRLHTFLASLDSHSPQVIGIVLMSWLLTCMAIPLTRSSPVGTEYFTQPSKAVRRYFLEICYFMNKHEILGKDNRFLYIDCFGNQSQFDKIMAYICYECFLSVHISMTLKIIAKVFLYQKT